MHIIDSIHLVASGWLGCSLTDPHDCHVYAIDHGATASLIDAGCGLATDSIVENIRRAGIDPRKFRRVMLTHAHADHAAGARAIASTLGAAVWASSGTAAILRSADEDAAGLTAARGAGGYPETVHLSPTEVDRVLTRERIEEDGLRVDVVPSPGHAADHVCYLMEVAGRRILFAGDLVFARGRVAVLGTPDTDITSLRRSIEEVLALQPHAMLSGHGSMVVDRAVDHLGAAVDSFDRGALPPGLLT